MISSLALATSDTYTFEIVENQIVERLAIAWYAVAGKIVEALKSKSIDLYSLPYVKNNIESAFELLEKLQSFPSYLLDKKPSSIIALCNGKPSAIAIVSSRTRSLRLEYLCLHPQLLISSIKGIGGRFIEYIKTYASQRSHSLITLFSVASAIAFYKKHGFTTDRMLLAHRIQPSKTPIAEALKESCFPKGEVFIVPRDSFGRIMEDIGEAKGECPIIDSLFRLREASKPIIVLGILNDKEDFTAISMVNLEDPKSIRIENFFTICCKSSIEDKFIQFTKQLAEFSKRELKKRK